MIIKKYYVNNMNEAMIKIRRELGKDAIIISQRKVRRPGFWGFFAKKLIEVTVASDGLKKDEDIEVKNSIEAIKKVLKNTSIKENKFSRPEKQQSTFQRTNENTKGMDENLIKEIRDMKIMLSEVAVGQTNTKPRRSKIQIVLEKNDLNENVTKKILTKIKNLDDNIGDTEKAKKVIEEMVNVKEQDLSGTVVLVGPTGVGKTTTIAKLAGRLSLTENKKIGLITIDTYRIGAVEQLKTYADIMNIPFKVVISIKEMEEAMNSMKDRDVVLVDTTGRSSKNTMQISELRAYIEKLNSVKVNLVMSCCTKNSDIKTIMDGYKQLNYNSIIITKLDETSTYGSIINILDYSKKPVMFFTTGQNVPDDIKTLTPQEVSKLVLGEDNIC